MLTQFAQMQATPRCACGTRASSAALNVASWHQQGVSAAHPAACAQAFAWPHKGHRLWHGGVDVASA
jgi:hypothetical protein